MACVCVCDCVYINEVLGACVRGRKWVAQQVMAIYWFVPPQHALVTLWTQNDYFPGTVLSLLCQTDTGWRLSINNPTLYVLLIPWQGGRCTHTHAGARGGGSMVGKLVAQHGAASHSSLALPHAALSLGLSSAISIPALSRWLTTSARIWLDILTLPSCLLRNECMTFFLLL